LSLASCLVSINAWHPLFCRRFPHTVRKQLLPDPRFAIAEIYTNHLNAHVISILYTQNREHDTLVWHVVTSPFSIELLPRAPPRFNNAILDSKRHSFRSLLLERRVLEVYHALMGPWTKSDKLDGAAAHFSKPTPNERQ